MCGLCGMIGKLSQPVHVMTLHRMNDAMIHRGPDDEGYFTHDNVGLGFRRLSIIDISEGHQPLYNEDRTISLVFNGEIYNYRALRESLRQMGHRFTTHSDGEVILHLYEEHGIETNVLMHMQPGGIILMHSAGGTSRLPTVQALPYIIEITRAAGYSFTTVPELLGISAYGPSRD
jgi:asparagine synthetase B (glutamine-hydrolysing)